MTPPRKRPSVQKALAASLWPKADREGWLAAQEGGGPLDDGGAASHMCTHTRDDLTKRYAYYLDFLDRRGRLEVNGSAASCVTQRNILDYVAFLQAHLSSVTLAQSLYKVARVAKCLAPTRDWAWLQRIVRRLDARAIPRNKRADVVEITELIALGRQLMQNSEMSRDRTPIARALLYRDGLMIALLATDPLRLKNIRILEIGRTILKDGETWSLALSPKNTKNKREHIAVLPDWIGPYIDSYIEAYRPYFPNADKSDALWMSRQGNQLSEISFERVTEKRTLAAFGKAINPHLFRDCLATSTAVHHGARMGLAMTILGHQSSKVTERHYNQANMIDAVRAYQQMLLEEDAP